MLSEKALLGLGRILVLSDPKDVKLLEIRTIQGMPQSRSRREAIAAILTNTENPIKLLRQPTIKKAILAEYLKETGTAESKDLTKYDCIRICLQKWDIEDDTFKQKYRSEDDVFQALTRLDAQMQKKIDEIKLRYQQKREPLLASLSTIKKRRTSSTKSSSSSEFPSLASPSSSSTFTTCASNSERGSARKSLPLEASVTPQDEVRIIMEKFAKPRASSASVPKGGNTCTSLDVKPDPSALIPRPATPDSSDTLSMFWASW